MPKWDLMSDIQSHLQAKAIANRHEAATGFRPCNGIFASHVLPAGTIRCGVVGRGLRPRRIAVVQSSDNRNSCWLNRDWDEAYEWKRIKQAKDSSVCRVGFTKTSRWFRPNLASVLLEPRVGFTRTSRRFRPNLANNLVTLFMKCVTMPAEVRS